MQETWVQSLGREDLLQKEIATHSSILVWEIPWTEKPSGLQSIFGSQRVGHNRATEHAQIRPISEKKGRGFPGGPVVKNLPCNAGDTTSAPGPGRFHTLQGN